VEYEDSASSTAIGFAHSLQQYSGNRLVRTLIKVTMGDEQDVVRDMSDIYSSP
jgi:hypothetical protein